MQGVFTPLRFRISSGDVMVTGTCPALSNHDCVIDDVSVIVIVCVTFPSLHTFRCAHHTSHTFGGHSTHRSVMCDVHTQSCAIKGR